MDVEELNRSSEWGPYVDEILGLYREGWKLKRIAAKMQSEHGLKKTERQYKGLFNKHKVKKNRTAATWATVSRRLHARQGKRSEVFLNGEKIPEKKLERAAKRYAHDNHSSSGASSGEHIIVQTPPMHQDLAYDDDVENVPRENDNFLINEHVGTPWDLVAFTPQQRTQSEIAHSYEGPVISLQHAHDIEEAICLPDEAMDDEDLGNLRTLTRRVRQLRLQGTRILQYSDEKNLVLPMMGSKWSTSAVLGERWLPNNSNPRSSQSIERPLVCDWAWESLAGIFEKLITSQMTERLRSKLYGHLTDMEALSRCTKTDMLNSLVAVMMQSQSLFLGTEQVKCVDRLCLWLSQPRHLEVLKLLLSSPNRPLATAFAFKFFEAHIYRSRGGRTRENLINVGALKVCFEFLCSPKRRLPMPKIDIILDWGIKTGIPECVTVLLPIVGTDWTAQSLLCHPNQYGDLVKLPSEAVAFLLSHGASAEYLLEAAIAAFLQASLSNRNTTKQYQLLLMGLSKGADVDMITTRTFPLSIAEYAASHARILGDLLQDWAKDPVAREVIDIYRSSCNSLALKRCSSVAGEVALFGLSQHGLRHRWLTNSLVQIRSLLEYGIDPSLHTLIQSENHEHALRNSPELRPHWAGSSDNKPPPTAAHRALFGLHHLVSKPVDICFVREDAEATQLLMDFGSPPPRQLQRSPGRMKDHSFWWISNLFRDYLAYPPRQASFEFMRQISYYFTSSRYRQDILPVGDCILLWAIRDEDETLVRRLVAKGVDIRDRRFPFEEQISGFHPLHKRTPQCTPFIKALEVCSLRFAKAVWDIQSNLFPPIHQQPGADELIGICRSEASKDRGTVKTISFLLELGATINEPSAWGHDVALTPLQATLEAYYARWERASRYPTDLPMVRRTEAICEYLVERGAHVDALESEAITPLLSAAFHGDEKMMGVLLRNGANPNLTRSVYLGRKKGRVVSSPLMMVSCFPRCLCLEPHELLQKEPLRNRFEMTQLLLQAGADVDLPLESGSTVLVEVCRRGCLPTMELLLQHAADVSKRSKDGFTPIEAAASCYNMSSKRIEMVFKLLNCGAHVAKRHEGLMDQILWESLHLRDHKRFEDRFTYLSRSEALCSLGDKCQWNALIGVEAILEASADVNYVSQTKEGRLTPLKAAVSREDLSGVMCLLEHGVDAVVAGHSALCEAIRRDLYEITQVLHDAGARPLWGSED